MRWLQLLIGGVIRQSRLELASSVGLSAHHLACASTSRVQSLCTRIHISRCWILPSRDCQRLFFVPRLGVDRRRFCLLQLTLNYSICRIPLSSNASMQFNKIHITVWFVRCYTVKREIIDFKAKPFVKRDFFRSPRPIGMLICPRNLLGSNMWEIPPYIWINALIVHSREHKSRIVLAKSQYSSKAAVARKRPRTTPIVFTLRWKDECDWSEVAVCVKQKGKYA